jgi:hypothetical protein
LSQVLEVQAAVGGMTTCSKLSAVGILWGLGIVGALSYELWDVLSAPLDSVSEPLKDEPLLRVFEAYCLAVLRNTGPAPCAILMDQLVPAGHAFSSVMLRSAGDARKKLLRALVQAGLVPSDSRSTRVVDGHMMLYDVINTGELCRLSSVKQGVSVESFNFSWCVGLILQEICCDCVLMHCRAASMFCAEVLIVLPIHIFLCTPNCCYCGGCCREQAGVDRHWHAQPAAVCSSWSPFVCGRLGAAAALSRRA